MNRIRAAINKVNQSIADHGKTADLEALSRTLDITFEEYCYFQDVKSLAQADARATFDEAMTIYQILGSGPDAFNAQPVAEKVVVTKAITELALQSRAQSA